jgi:uncharacterized membrane protein
VLLAGWNWDRIPRQGQLGLVFGVPALAFAGALVANGGGRDLWARRLVFLGAVAAGGIFVAVGDMYHSPQPGVSLLWAIALCVSAALVPSPFLTAAAGGVTIAWLIAQVGFPPAPWTFLLLGPLLALAVEQVPDRTPGAVVAAAIAVWAFAVAGDTWPDANATLFVWVLLAGAALDAWAHAPADRRPAFARLAMARFVRIRGRTRLPVRGPRLRWRSPWAPSRSGLCSVSATFVRPRLRRSDWRGWPRGWFPLPA